MLDDLLRDPEYRENLARNAFYRERLEDAAKDAEHELAPVEYLTLDWDSLADSSKRPYRSGVAYACDELLTVVTAIA